MMPPFCSETRLDASTYRRCCVLDAGHDGDHMDARGVCWPPPGVTLWHLKARWGHTHRVAWTGSYWVATARRRDAHWRTEVEPTVELLEQRLMAHNCPPAPAHLM